MDKDTKQIIFFAIGLVALFGIFIGVGYYSNTNPEIVTLQDMIQKTLAGEETEDNFLYNGFAFVKVDDMWYTEISLWDTIFEVPLHFNPRQVENITLVDTLNEQKFNSAKNFYITFDPSESDLEYVALSAAEISLNMARAMHIKPIAACSRNETEPCFYRPIINCTNTDDAVIYLREANETKITLDDNCITIEGKDSEIVKATDWVILHWYGIV